MIQNRLYVCFLVIIVAAIFSGCATHPIVAKRYPVDQKMIPDFTSNNAIALDNTQNDQNKILVGTNMGHKFKGDLHQFTEIAIETLEGELKNKNITVEPGAGKNMKISVSKVHFESRWSGFWCESFIQVETGDGYKAEIDGHDSNAWILPPCINGSLNHAVVAILNDDKIIEYLNR